MPIPEFLGLTRLAKPLTSAEGNRILERDRYRCRYCGLDGLASFENSLIMTVDFLHPRARKGKKIETNLVTACRPCNVIKGHRTFGSLEDAKAYVLSAARNCRRNGSPKPLNSEVNPRPFDPGR
jgi:5-methylcytosine-specific restriction endonuclease McrA